MKEREKSVHVYLPGSQAQCGRETRSRLTHTGIKQHAFVISSLDWRFTKSFQIVNLRKQEVETTLWPWRSAVVPEVKLREYHSQGVTPSAKDVPLLPSGQKPLHLICLTSATIIIHPHSSLYALRGHRCRVAHSEAYQQPTPLRDFISDLQL